MDKVVIFHKKYVKQREPKTEQWEETSPKRWYGRKKKRRTSLFKEQPK
jgi:hypothetical protein